MSQVVQTHEQQFYLTKLMGFQYDIVYRTRHSNKVADALSRQGDLEAQFHAFTVLQNPIIGVIQKANFELEEMRQLHKLFAQDGLSAEFTVNEGMMFFQGRILVPELPNLKREIFKLYHEVPMAGHGGVQKTYTAISELFYWKNMKCEV